jgi:hypothetical protein
VYTFYRTYISHKVCASHGRASYRCVSYGRASYRRAFNGRVSYRRMSYRRDLMGVHLTSVHLIRIYLMGVRLIGVHLICVYLTGVLLIDVHLTGAVPFGGTITHHRMPPNTVTARVAYFWRGKDKPTFWVYIGGMTHRRHLLQAYIL